MPLPYPVIVIPGITATYLKNEYDLPPEYVWTVMTKKYERLALHPNDLRYEVSEPARLVPDQLYEIAYKELIEELRYNLRSEEDKQVPVFLLNLNSVGNRELRLLFGTFDGDSSFANGHFDLGGNCYQFLAYPRHNLKTSEPQP